MKDKAIAVAAQHAGDIENVGILQTLLHTCAYGVLIVFGLHESNGNVGLVIEDIVGAFTFPSGG